MERRDINIIMENPIDWEKFRDKTVLVTGATGRLGMYIAEALSEATIRWNLNTTILLLARSMDKLHKVYGKSLQLPYMIPMVQDVMEPIKYKRDVHYIFHTAGLASPQDFTKIPVDTLWGHVQGTRNVLELAKNNHCQRVLYVSTVETYGTWEAERGIREDDMGAMRCDNARACYPEAKRLCETMLASYEKQYGIDYVGVRLCHTFGPGILLTDGRAFSEFINCILHHENIVLHSDGSAVRTYTYTPDAIGAIFLAVTKGKDKYYNIANLDNMISIRDLAELIAGMDSLHKTRVQYEVPKGEQLAYLPFKLGIMDVTRINKLGWASKTNLENAFRWTVDSFIQNNLSR